MKMSERLGTLVVYMIVAVVCIKGRVALNVEFPNQISEATFNTDKIAFDKKIVCYFRSWSVGTGFDIENDIDPNICTHIIYAFASFDERGTIIEKDTGNIFVISAIVGTEAIIFSIM